MNNYWKAQQILNSYKRKVLKEYPLINENSGIYIFYRTDEITTIKSCYVGQAKHLLTRIAQHFHEYNHLANSLRKHGFYNAEKCPNGWQVKVFPCAENELNENERKYILLMSNSGYQLFNKTSGGQDLGKVGIAENSDGLGYRKGVANGYDKARKEIKELFDKYLNANIKEPTNKIKERKLLEFCEWLTHTPNK